MHRFAPIALFFLLLIAPTFAQASPDAGRWAVEPHAWTSSEVFMEAVPVEWPGGVQYCFEIMDGPGRDSGWQDEPFCVDFGLEPLTDYTYRIRLRQKLTGEELEASGEVTVRTRAAEPGEGTDSRHVGRIDRAIAAGELELIPLMINGDKDDRINIVVINRWEEGQREAYNTPERREEFIEDARHVLRAFEAGGEEAIDPYPAYREFFNVWAIWWPGMPPWKPDDRENGMHWTDYNEIRARFFLPWQVEGKGWVTHLAMFNGSGGGGGAGRRLDERVGDAMIVGNEIAAFIHEFNHTAPGIPDEYTSSGMWGRGGEGSTATNEYRRDFVKWRAWIESDVPVPTPYSREYLDVTGAFEGGIHRMAHLFRPTARGCLMGAGSFAGDGQEMCVVCRQRAVQRFYQWVDPIEEATPRRRKLRIDGPTKLEFSVQRVKPVPDTQRTEWRLNEKVIAEGVDRVEVELGMIEEYELTFALVDETPFVRPDPPFASRPRAERSWNITNSAPTSEAKPLTVLVTPRQPGFAEIDSGSVLATGVGGVTPYEYRWNDGSTSRGLEHLDEGTYTVTVIDAELRSAMGSATIVRSLNARPELVSEWTENGWRLSLVGVDRQSANWWWDKGLRNVAKREPLGDGVYSCTVSCGGDQNVLMARLRAPEELLAAVVVRALPSTGGRNDGFAQFDVSGGDPPYTYEWSDGELAYDPERPFLAPGEYEVVVRDANRSCVELQLSIASEPDFELAELIFEAAEGGAVRIANTSEELEYLWYERDRPPHLPRYPHGTYAGFFTAADGRRCEADAFVIQNKAGLFVDERAERNDYGHWVHLEAWVDGREADPRVVEVDTKQEGQRALELVVESQEHGEASWSGGVRDGKLRLEGEGADGGAFELSFASFPEEPDHPLHVGAEFTPAKGANYFVAGRRVDTGALSRNRRGVAITRGPVPELREALAPDAVTGAKLLLWLDASDVDADGATDDPPPRRGAVIGWQGKAAGASCRDFVFYQPNVQNGLGVASWETIWIQSLAAEVSGYQTIFMVRREHDLSATRTSPWSGLNDLIGVGEYGDALMSTEVSDAIRGGAVYLDGGRVDPFATSMPTGFYQATYVLDAPAERALGRTTGHWEGALAECLMYDGELTDEERLGVEEYLRRKWLSAVHVE